ncbi:MAG: glycoside hydrolase family 5 protein [Phycisphaerales bacterium]
MIVHHWVIVVGLFSLCVMAGVSCQSQVNPPAAAAAAPSAQPTHRLRGFTNEGLSPEDLRKAADWGGNNIRYMIRPGFMGEHKYHCSESEAWRRILADLPAQLDEAKRLGITVILDLHDVPNPNQKNYPADRKEKTRAFWADEDNLRIMIQCWKDIAEVCKDRPEPIWFDLYNEPLNWDDMPGGPKLWPAWAQQIIDAIRTIDKHHTIVVEPGPGGLCWGFKNFPLLKGDPIVYSPHFYQPQQYTHQGISDIANTDLAHAYLERQRDWPGTFGDSGGGLWNKQRIEQELAPAIAFQKKYNVRLYIGEFSVVKWAPHGADYLRDCISIFEEHGWDWSYHALSGYPGWRLDMTDTYEGPKDAKLADQPTDRFRAVHEFLLRNRAPK